MLSKLKRKILIISVIAILLFLFVNIFTLIGATKKEKITIYAPATPSSVPLIIAAQKMTSTKIVIFTNHSQAHSLFLRDDIQILSTGLSVGINFYKNKIPIQIVNSYVVGLTSMVTYGFKAKSFKDLKNYDIYLPLEGGPIDEITKFFVKKEGLVFGKDIKAKYLPFRSSVELLKLGKIKAVALPEPFISLLKSNKKIYISFSYYDLYNKLTGKTNGYPQVGTFVKSYWAKKHSAYLRKLNEEIARAIELIKSNPQKAVDLTKSYFKFPEKVIKSAIINTKYYLTIKYELKKEIFDYYKAIEKPLNEKEFSKFFYIY